MVLQGKGIITQEQKEILKKFAKIEGAVDFVLTGGTALSEFYLARDMV